MTNKKRIFITGASGYVGFQVAQAFRQDGYLVSGLVRSSQNAKKLAQNEIQPVLGDMRDPSSYVDAAQESDVIIHVAAAGGADFAELDQKTMDTLIDVSSRSQHRPKTLIYTSGTWIYGNTGPTRVDEETVVTPAQNRMTRFNLEKRVLQSSGFKGVVIRPGCVYGRGGESGNLTAIWFQDAYERRQLEVIEGGENHWAMVHVHDLARGYLNIVQKGVSGEIFNLMNAKSSSVIEMVRAVARVTGLTESEIRSISLQDAVKKMGPLAQGLALDQNVSSEKAKRVLGWDAKKESFVEGVETYYAAWKAYL